MPLYKKAINFNTSDLELMTYDECYELLLCFRYLHLRNDQVISKQKLEQHIADVTKRMEYLASQATGEKDNQ